MARPPSAPVSAGQPLGSATSPRRRTATMGATDANFLPWCISNKCISHKCVLRAEVHSLRLRRVARGDVARMQSPASLHEWIMNANVISKPRYSAAVNAIPQPCASLPFFFPFRNASPSPTTGSDAGRRAGCYEPIGASYARSIGDQTHPSLRAPSLLF